jgi:AcrR family transcriptional regulator
LVRYDRRVATRELILDALQRLVLEGDSSPSLDAVAAAAGVSKGGLLHHFPDRRSMVVGLLLRAVEQTDTAMTQAALDGTAAVTWIRMSAVAGPAEPAARAVLALIRLTGAGRIQLPDEIGASIRRWQELISSEVGDPVLGEVVRLVGDGLFVEALTGQSPDPGRVDAILDRLLPS